MSLVRRSVCTFGVCLVAWLCVSCVGADQTITDQTNTAEDASSSNETPQDTALGGSDDTATLDTETPEADTSVSPTEDAALDTTPDTAQDEPPELDCEELTACGTTCVDLRTDPSNCGLCGRTCVLPNAEAGCTSGTCAVNRCTQGFVDADGSVLNGCEVENLCTPGGECTTTCDSTGEIACMDGNETCMPPAEMCNAVDDNCNGSCDEGSIPGCRTGVHRGVGNGHVYSTNLNFVSSAPYRLERENYFYVYAVADGPNLRPIRLCRKGNGRRFITTSLECEGGGSGEMQLGFVSTQPGCGSTPLYRLYHPEQGNHFFTISAPERDNARDNLGYLYESIAGHVWTAR